MTHLLADRSSFALRLRSPHAVFAEVPAPHPPLRTSETPCWSSYSATGGPEGQCKRGRHGLTLCVSSSRSPFPVPLSLTSHCCWYRCYRLPRCPAMCFHCLTTVSRVLVVQVAGRQVTSRNHRHWNAIHAHNTHTRTHAHTHTRTHTHHQSRKRTYTRTDTLTTAPPLPHRSAS
jgi:hypothetical protein